MPDTSGPTVRRVRLAQGVLDTVVEHLVFRDELPDNAAHLLHVSPGAELNWRLVRERDELAADGWKIGDESRARLTADLDSGWATFAPTRPLERADLTFFAHWRIDPDTGETLGMGNRGFGQTEETILLNQELRTMIPVSRRIAARVLCWIGMVTLNFLIGTAISAVATSSIAGTIATIMLALTELGDENLGRTMLKRCIGNISPI